MTSNTFDSLCHEALIEMQREYHGVMNSGDLQSVAMFTNFLKPRMLHAIETGMEIEGMGGLQFITLHKVPEQIESLHGCGGQCSNHC
jgi:hypothetical protein